ncbi:MAG TPA: gamma subclass chorismate mutase AroQ [Victivallales bacterium]|nr:gamma subclass chorismate mutase AroQ [Victivallales bacterium]
MKIKLIVSTFVILTCLSFVYADNSTPSTNSVKNFTNLCVLLNNRLKLMKEVAAYKYINKLPIEDRNREKIVLNASIKKAIKEGLQPASVKSFFSTQIELSKYIQNQWFLKWDTTGFPKEYIPMNLKHEIRPKLIIIGDEIVKSIKQIKDEKIEYAEQKIIINKIINTKFITATQKEKLLQAIITIKK